MFAKQDLCLLLSGSDYPNTCPRWGGCQPCCLDLLVNKSVFVWLERLYHQVTVRQAVILSWGHCCPDHLVTWYNILVTLSWCFLTGKIWNHSCFWVSKIIVGTDVCVALWKWQVLDHWMKFNIPSQMRSIVLRAYLQWCKMYLVARLSRSTRFLAASQPSSPSLWVIAICQDSDLFWFYIGRVHSWKFPLWASY